MKVNELQAGMVIDCICGAVQARVEAVAYDWVVVRDIDGRVWLIEPGEEFELHEKEEKDSAEIEQPGAGQY